MKQIEKVLYDGFTYIDGGVCAAKGFRANGVYCGIKENPTKKPDLCLVVSDKLCRAAGVFTSNKVKAAPVLVSKAHLEQTGGKAWGMVLSSKNANCCNADGIDKANRVCELAAEQMGVQPEELLIAQTGVIGQVLPIEPFEQGMGKVYDGLSAENHEQAAIAIMTTDTVPKEVAVEFQLGGKTCHVGAMGKGSGMICPNMATTLNVVTTDCAISAELLQTALSDVVQYRITACISTATSPPMIPAWYWQTVWQKMRRSLNRMTIMPYSVRLCISRCPTSPRCWQRTARVRQNCWSVL